MHNIKQCYDQKTMLYMRLKSRLFFLSNKNQLFWIEIDQHGRRLKRNEIGHVTGAQIERKQKVDTLSPHKYYFFFDKIHK